MKYIDAEKLIAEIERRQKRAEHYEEISLTYGERSYWSGEDDALALLTTFITSLQQEPPEVDLEKEIDEKWDEFVSSEGEREDFTNIARHFYSLGLNARKEE